MKRFLLVIICLFNIVHAQELSLSTLVTPQNISFDTCTKVFNTDSQNLYYLTIASINANRFQITEMQSKSGYIMFNAVNKPYLAQIVKLDAKSSMLKITASNYYFPPGVVLNIFKYIEVNPALKSVELPIIR